MNDLDTQLPAHHCTNPRTCSFLVHCKITIPLRILNCFYFRIGFVYFNGGFSLFFFYTEALFKNNPNLDPNYKF